MRQLVSRSYLRKENQLKQKKKEDETKEEAVRRVYVVVQALCSGSTSDRSAGWMAPGLK